MFIKYEYLGDKVIMNLQSEANWKICFKLFDDEGCEDYNLYLITDEETVVLRDVEYWCQGRPDLRYTAIGELFEEIVDVIAHKLEHEPDIRVIDIPAIENKLIEEKYEKMWMEKGFIKIDEHGRW